MLEHEPTVSCHWNYIHNIISKRDWIWISKHASSVASNLMAIWLEVLWVWMTLYSDDTLVSFSRPDGQKTIQHIHQLILNMILTATLNKEKSYLLWPRNLNVFPNFYLEVFPVRCLQKSKKWQWTPSSFMVLFTVQKNWISCLLPFTYVYRPFSNCYTWRHLRTNCQWL